MKCHVDKKFGIATNLEKIWNNAIVVKSGNDDIVGHVPETLAKKLLNFMKSHQIEIMDSDVTGDPRPAPEGKWVIGGGIEIPCKYRLYGPKSVKKEVRAALIWLSEFICKCENIMIQNTCVR